MNKNFKTRTHNFYKNNIMIGNIWKILENVEGNSIFALCVGTNTTSTYM
jgi:hypothetical protein